MIAVPSPSACCGEDALVVLTCSLEAVEAAKAHASEREFYSAKISTAAFYATHVLPVALGLARVIDGGAASVVETDAGLI